MRGGIVLIALGLLVGYLALTGRYKCFEKFFSCIGGEDCECSDKSTGSNNATVRQLTEPFSKFVTLPPLASFTK